MIKYLFLLLISTQAFSQTFIFGTNGAVNPPEPVPPGPTGTIYVDISNSGSEDGSSAHPYNTIQEAASVAVAGDVVKIRSGTYRETIAPTNSGTSGNLITYTNDTGATPIVSGLENVGTTGWTVHIGNIYKKTITLPCASNFNASTGGTNTTLLANQIFDDGDMMPLARYPKISTPEDIMNKTKMRTLANTSAWSNTSITDAGLSGFASINGGQVFTNGWFLSETRTITSHSGSVINFTSGTINSSAFRKFYYVTNALSLLTQAKEWHYASGVLYFWQNGGGSPTGVEYKARNWGFDLRGKSYIKIDGITFVGCEPVFGNSSTANVLIDHVTSTYQNHAFTIPNSSGDYYYNARQVGVVLGGANNVVQNSTFKYGIQGVWAGGNTVITNCKFSYYGYDGIYGAPITPLNNSNGVQITHNTIEYVGRSNINLASYTSGNNTPHSYLNIDISYNELSHHSLMLADNGSIYSNVSTNLTGTRIHHNWFHHNDVSRVGGVDGVQVTSGYFDQASGPVTFDHNVTSAGDECDFYDEGTVTGTNARNMGGHKIYNNTFAGTTDRSVIVYTGSSPVDVHRNNIYRGSLQGGGTTDAANSSNLQSASNPLFVGGTLTNPGTYFILQSGSPARGIGATLSGINDDDTSPKDAGAYPYGQTAWTTPGYQP